MPAHIYISKLYTPDSPEIKELVAEFSEKGYRLELEEDKEEEVKFIRLVKDENHRITLVFMFIGIDKIYTLHYVEIMALYESEYKELIEEIKRKLRIYSIGWI